MKLDLSRKSQKGVRMKQDYRERFLRSIGIISESQLSTIKQTSIALAGLGLGGSLFINLVRMGFEKFHIADLDIFERTNINRQRLAKETTIGRSKVECALEEAKAINPDVVIKTFPAGVNQKNVNEFLKDIDWVVDVVDVFAMPEKLALHAVARKNKIPVISTAAMGFAGFLIVFNDQTPSFQELTGMDAQDDFVENFKKFIQFIGPHIPDYMHDQLMKSLDRSTHVPFVVPGIEICAAFCTAEIAKNILGIGQKTYAPQGLFIDAFNHKIETFKADYRARTYNYPAKTKKIDKKAS